MSKTLATTFLITAIVVVIVVVDVLFLRDHFGLRLVVNIGIVVVAAAIYYGLLR